MQADKSVDIKGLRASGSSASASASANTGYAHAHAQAQAHARARAPTKSPPSSQVAHSQAISTSARRSTRERSTTVTSTSTTSTIRPSHSESQRDQASASTNYSYPHTGNRGVHSRSHQNLRAASISSSPTATPEFITTRSGTLNRNGSTTSVNVNTSTSMSNGSLEAGTTGSASPTPTAPGSRSRSGSVARYLSVNTTAAGVIPAVPTMSMTAVAHALNSVESTDQFSISAAATPISGVSPQLPTGTSSPASSGTSPSGIVAPGSAFIPGEPQHQVLRDRERDRTLPHRSSSRTTMDNGRKSSSSALAVGRGSSSSKDAQGRGSRSDRRDREGKTAGSSRRTVTAGQGQDDADEEDRDGFRVAPRLHLHDAEPAPPTLMYWSKAPTWGTLPTHKMRSHSATVVDNTTIWLFGGCDDRDFWRDVMCLDVETMEFTRPDMLGELPPPCRAHTATLVDRRLFVFGGGQGNVYYNTLYILDTVSRKWSHVPFPSPPTTSSLPSHSHTLSGTGVPPSSLPLTDPAPDTSSSPSNAADTTPPSESAESEVVPRPRRAHTTVLFKNKLVVFGGGNGTTALNDVWTLDVSVPPDRMRWTKQQTTGNRPSPRGYHTANLVENIMIIVGGSDGRQTFSDIFCLNLETMHWSKIRIEKTHRRLAHTATQVGSYLFIMGGHDGSQYTNELLLYNLVSLQYEPRPTRGISPAARAYHAAAHADGRLWIFGGFDGRSAFDDVHMLDLASSAYLSQVTGFSIQPN